jgi:hypothetical protein
LVNIFDLTEQIAPRSYSAKAMPPTEAALSDLWLILDTKRAPIQSSISQPSPKAPITSNYRKSEIEICGV